MRILENTNKFTTLFLTALITLSAYTGLCQFIQVGVDIGSTGVEQVTASVSDGNGNWLVTGTFTGTVDFDPGPAVLNLIATGSTSKGFIASYSQSLELQWAIQFTGTGSVFINSMDWDDDGNILLCGSFLGSIDFNPGSGNNTVNGGNNSTIFICKLNSNAEFVWVKTIGSSGFDVARNVRSGPEGKVYVSGEFSGLVDFDPGVGEFILNGSGQFNPNFVMTLLADGTFLWAGTFNGSAYFPGSNACMEVDSEGSLYLTGSYDYLMDADPSANTVELTLPGGTWDNFVLKFNSEGVLEWAKAFGGYSNDNDYVFDLAISPDDWISISGRFTGSIDLNPGPDEFIFQTNQGSGYVVNLNSNGEFISAFEFEGVSVVMPTSIQWNSEGQLYCFLECGNGCDIDPGEGVQQLASNHLVVINSQSELVSTLFTGMSTQAKLVADNYSNLLVALTVFGTQTYTGLNGPISLVSNGIQDIGLLHVTPCTNSGCMNAQACNYSPDALCESGACNFPEGVDFDCSGVLDVEDILQFISNFGCTENCGPFDINGDGMVGIQDLIVLLGEIG